MTTAIYPGRFDPVTAGHLDIVLRASKLFEKVVISVFDAPEKQTMFTTQERIALFREALQGAPGIEVKPFTGLVVHHARQEKAAAIVRGIRMNADF